MGSIASPGLRPFIAAKVKPPGREGSNSSVSGNSWAARRLARGRLSAAAWPPPRSAIWRASASGRSGRSLAGSSCPCKPASWPSSSSRCEIAGLPIRARIPRALTTSAHTPRLDLGSSCAGVATAIRCAALSPPLHNCRTFPEKMRTPLDDKPTVGMSAKGPMVQVLAPACNRTVNASRSVWPNGGAAAMSRRRPPQGGPVR